MNRLWSRYGLVVLVILFFSACHLHNKSGASFKRFNPFSTYLTAGRHPIESLSEVAHANFVSLRERQSKTFEEAELEYHRRYGRDPPPGFQEWFRYAVAHDSVLVDDYDLINHNLNPFWKFSPLQLRDSIEYAASLYPDNLERREIRNGRYYGVGDGWASHVEDLGQLLEDVVQYIPDVVFVINTLDEPREIIGRTEQDLSKLEFSENPQKIWSSILDSCADDDLDAKASLFNNSIPFIHPSSESISSSRNPCHHTSFALQHGIFTCPVTTSITDSPVPILSQAAPLGFHDILYPTFWYLDNYKRHTYSETEDIAWADKTNTLYWAGSDRGDEWCELAVWTAPTLCRICRTVERGFSNTRISGQDRNRWTSGARVTMHCGRAWPRNRRQVYGRSSLCRTSTRQTVNFRHEHSSLGFYSIWMVTLFLPGTTRCSSPIR
jgi:hypothetical protein